LAIQQGSIAGRSSNEALLDDPAMLHCWIVVGVQKDRKTLSSNREK
jgi:hypothetical protein